MPMTGVSTNARQGWAIIAMYGMPGVGKSALAEALWVRLRQVHPGKQLRVEWAPGTPFTRDVLVRRLLAELSSSLDLNGAQADVCLRLLAGELARSGNLVLIDGLSEAFTRSEVESLLKQLGVEDSTLIIVGRAKPTEFDADQLFEVRPLSNELSRRFLRRQLGERAEGHPRELAEVVDYCEGLPRALEAVCDLVWEEGELPAAAAALRDPATRLSRLSVPGHDLAAELSFSYAGLHEEQRRALAAISLLKSDSVGAWAVSLITGAEVMDTDGWLADLEDARLLTAMQRNPQAPADLPRYQRHRLVGLALEKADERVRASFGLSRGRLDREYLRRAETVYEHWWERGTILPTLEFGGDRRMDTMRWLRLEYRDILQAAVEARRTGENRPCWSIGQLVAGIFPILGCDWELWEWFFTEARAAADKDADGDAKARLAVSAIIQAQGLRCLFSGRLDEAAPLLRESVERAEHRDSLDADVQIRGYVHHAEILMERGRYLRARMDVRKVTPILDPRPVDDDQNWASFVSAVVNRNLELGMWHRVDLLQNARILLKENQDQDPTRESRMSLYIGDALRENGCGREAEKEYYEARLAAEAVGDRFTAARADFSLAYLLLDAHMIEDAKSLINHVRPIYESSPDNIWRQRFEFIEARVAFEERQWAKATQLLVPLERRSDLDRDSWLRANVTLLLARAWINWDRPKLAEQAVTEAKAVLREIQNPWAMAQAHYILGLAYCRTRRSQAARGELREARGMFARSHDARGECDARRALASAWPKFDVYHRGRDLLSARRLDRRIKRTTVPPEGSAHKLFSVSTEPAGG